MKRENHGLNEEEITALANLWGGPARVSYTLDVDPKFWWPWGSKGPTRRGEVMFLLPRPGGLLLHRKAHYPPGQWRLLTGGIEFDEPIRETIAREPLEEVGLVLPVRRYVAVIAYDIRTPSYRWQWATHVFLLAPSDAPLQPEDDEIEETIVLPLSQMPAIATQLETLSDPWHDWGRFRAIGHRVVHEYVTAEELRLEE